MTDSTAGLALARVEKVNGLLITLAGYQQHYYYNNSNPGILRSSFEPKVLCLSLNPTYSTLRFNGTPPVPVTVKHRDQPDSTSAGSEDEQQQTRVFFKTASVFSASQTDPLPGAEQLPLAPPSEPLSGDSHQHLIAPLTRFAATLGYTVSIQQVPGATGGWCDAHASQIVIDADQSANGQLRTLVHETVHALGVDYQKYTRAQSEVIVDTTTLIVLSGVGLDTSGETIPYVAGWGEDGALEAVTEFATLIDSLARKVENAITTTIETVDSDELACAVIA